MPVWRLIPIDHDPNWKASAHRGPVVVRASNEASAPSELKRRSHGMLQVEDRRRPTGKTARVFVGLKVAPEIAQELAQLAHSLEDPTSRLVPSADMHLTLLPPWDKTCIPETTEKLRAALSGLEPFTLTFARLGYWPSRYHPRILCAECTPTDELKALQSALMHAFGQKDNWSFQPHVTLARMQRGRTVAAAKNQIDHELSLVQSINSVALF